MVSCKHCLREGISVHKPLPFQSVQSAHSQLHVSFTAVPLKSPHTRIFPWFNHFTSSQTLHSFFAFFCSSISNITMINCFSVIPCPFFIPPLHPSTIILPFFPFSLCCYCLPHHLAFPFSLICSERVIYTATTHTEQSSAEQSGEGSLTCQNGHHLRNTTKLFSPLCFIYPSTTH